MSETDHSAHLGSTFSLAVPKLGVKPCQAYDIFPPFMAPRDINRRIRRVTEDLQALHEELHKMSLASPDRSQRAQLLDELLTLDVIQDFKAAIDHMRHFLWAYIEAASQKSGDNTDLKMQTLRMERATEMLRILRRRLDHPALRQIPEANSFFEEIQRIADAAMTRHEKRTGSAGGSGNSGS